MPRIELKGAVLAIKGELEAMSWRTVKRRVQAGGGQALYALDASCHAMIAGAGSETSQVSARARGVPILAEAQLIELLGQGFVEWEEVEAFADKASFDASVAELRAIFNAAPDANGWTRCLEIVEGCDPERLDDLLSYLDPFIAAWDVAKMGAWSCDERHPLMRHAPENIWVEGLPTDELRVAPPGWIYDMAQGHDHPKHAIVRALNLDGMRLNGALGANILDNPHLQNVRWLNLGRDRLPKTFYRALHTSALMRSVEELWLHAHWTHLEEAGWGAPTHSFDALKRLRLPYDHAYVSGTLPCLRGATAGEPLT